MSKNRSIIYAFLAPLLYLAAQMAASLAVSAVASVYVMRDIGGGVPADELFEETLLRTLDAVSRYTNHIMFAACVLLVFTLMVAYRGRQPGLWQAVGLTRGAEPSALALAALAGFALNMASSGLLNGLPLLVRADDGRFHFGFDAKTYPMLVVGGYGKGRTAALATDVAPHWVGGFVDWGKARITQNLSNGGFVEIGADYAKFFAQLLRWVAGEYPTKPCFASSNRERK